MDDATRGFIESVIDDAVKAEIVQDVQWVRDEIPISSMRDLALGYFVGMAESFSSGVAILKNSERKEDGMWE